MARPLDALRRRRALLGERLTREGRAHTFSLATWRLHHATLPLLDAVASGTVLDAGSGRSPYKERLRSRGLRVLSLAVEDRSGEADLIGDVQRMPEVATGSIDTVVCTQVLEHVPRPWDAMAELARVLAPGGALVASVPHLSAIHEAPHDYWRFTRFGLESLLSAHGLQVGEIRPSGGLLCFLGHALSMLWLGTLGGLPVLGPAAWALNQVVLVHGLGALDRLLGAASLFPCDYVVLARKPAAGAPDG